MQRLQNEIFTSLSKVIAELQTDLQYRPQVFFGIVMYPDYIKNYLLSIWAVALFYTRGRLIGSME